MKEIAISLSRAELLAAKACSAGMTWFDTWPRLYDGDQEIVVLWSPLAMVWSLANPNSNQRSMARWLIDNGLLPMWSLSGAYLSGAYLSGAYLSGADLSGAYLSRADLSRADLSGAYYPGGALPGGWVRNKDGFLVRG